MLRDGLYILRTIFWFSRPGSHPEHRSSSNLGTVLVPEASAEQNFVLHIRDERGSLKAVHSSPASRLKTPKRGLSARSLKFSWSP